MEDKYTHRVIYRKKCLETRTHFRWLFVIVWQNEYFLYKNFDGSSFLLERAQNHKKILKVYSKSWLFSHPASSTCVMNKFCRRLKNNKTTHMKAILSQNMEFEEMSNDFHWVLSNSTENNIMIIKTNFHHRKNFNDLPQST